jgi:hypothetical protein
LYLERRKKQVGDLSVSVKEKVGLKEAVGPGGSGESRGEDKPQEKETKDNQQ